MKRGEKIEYILASSGTAFLTTLIHKEIDSILSVIPEIPVIENLPVEVSSIILDITNASGQDINRSITTVALGVTSWFALRGSFMLVPKAINLYLDRKNKPKQIDQRQKDRIRNDERRKKSEIIDAELRKKEKNTNKKIRKALKGAKRVDITTTESEDVN